MGCPEGGKVEFKEFIMTEEDRIAEFCKLPEGFLMVNN